MTVNPVRVKQAAATLKAAVVRSQVKAQAVNLATSMKVAHDLSLLKRAEVLAQDMSNPDNLGKLVELAARSPSTFYFVQKQAAALLQPKVAAEKKDEKKEEKAAEPIPAAKPESIEPAEKSAEQLYTFEEACAIITKTAEAMIRLSNAQTAQTVTKDTSK